MNAARQANSFASWFFRNRITGKVTLAQFPNAPLWVFIVLTAVRLIAQPAGMPAVFIAVLSAIALSTWAIIEIGWGVNPFRRTLGAVVLIAELGMQAASLRH
jgi:hypothetical protein